MLLIIVLFSFSLSLLKRFVSLSATLVARILEEFHKGQAHGVHHRAKDVHEDIQGVTDDEDQGCHEESYDGDVWTHTYGQAVEYASQDTARETEGKRRT